MNDLLNPNIQLVEPGHKYVLSDNPEIKFRSVTEIVGEFFEPFWITVLSIWYMTIGFSLLLVFRKTKSGYLIAGVLSWITITFWVCDNSHIIFQASLIASEPNLFMTIRNFIGVVIAGLSIFSSHNAFHKI